MDEQTGAPRQYPETTSQRPEEQPAEPPSSAMPNKLAGDSSSDAPLSAPNGAIAVPPLQENNNTPLGVDGAPLPEAEEPTLPERLKTLLIGKPRDLKDRSLYKHVSLIAFLAWVGLGADGLSSSCYGPPEAFANLGEHRYLAIFLAAGIAATVFVISACYSHIIEAFPSGGGGYLVASKLLGQPAGVVSGCALLVDYVLTITVSIAAAGDALFGLLGPEWFGSSWKLYAEFAAIAFLVVLNLRGVKESIQVLLPIFLLFLLTHFLLIGGALGLHISAAGEVSRKIAIEVATDLSTPGIGLFVILGWLLHAYSLGAGTYTGIEAVSNSMQVMREPRVATAKRTMRYMAFSLALTAGGLIVAYLLLDIQHSGGKTLNQVLAEAFAGKLSLGEHWLGRGFIWATLLSEGALLIVAAQAGFIGGPRLLANMAQDSWMPRWFANLSDRLVTQNGIVLMGLAALAALLLTGGNVHALVVMYAINVFLTFSLSMIGMCRYWFSLRGRHPLWRRRFALFLVGAVLCVSILCSNIYLKREEGGWHTVLATCACIGLSFLIHRYYLRVGEGLRQLDKTLAQLPTTGEPNMAEPDPTQPAAVILVGDYSGLGIHTMLNAIRFAPDHFKSFIFVSVGVIDSGNFKGSEAVDDLRRHCEESLRRYVDLGRRLGMPSTSFLAIDTDAVDGLENICLEIARRYPKATFFAGQLVFQKDSWLRRMLHNQTAYSLQRRLQWAGVPMVILPTRVRPEYLAAAGKYRRPTK